MERKIETEQIKKSKMNANSIYDYARITVKNRNFVDVTIQEDDEDLIQKFDLTRLTSLKKIRSEKYDIIINILIKVGNLLDDYKNLLFYLEPANLFFNNDGTLKVKNRDVRETTDIKEEVIEENFLREYKAVVCCALIGKYSFKDYIEGGEDLFSKNTISEKIYSLKTPEEIQEYLDHLKTEYLNNESKTKITVNKTKNTVMRVMTCVLAICTLGLGIYGGRVHFVEQPYKDAIIKADNAYIQNDDVKLIESLKKVPVNKLDKNHKYVLALAYLQSENLSSKQKKNIKKNITLNSNNKYLEYWIQIGRLQINDAKDLAMQMSDEELLLYAYLKEKAKVEDDTKLSGDEKSSKLKDLDGKIKEISEKYKANDKKELNDSDKKLSSNQNNTANDNNATNQNGGEVVEDASPNN